MSDGPRDANVDPLSLDVATLGARYASGALSPVDVLDALYAAIDAARDDVNAFVSLDRDGARAAAQASTQRWRRGAALGPLDGVPVSIKDLVNVAGWPTRRGSLLTEHDAPAAHDAPATALLRAGGAVLFGKTTTSELGWAAISECPQTGVTRHPADPTRSAGGSSAGAAAHVARGWGPLALGTDAGGSIRIPASYCGLAGFKPTWGAVPLAPRSALGEFAHLGPIARSVADCREAMRVLSGCDPRDPASLYVRGAPPMPARLRIGVAIDAGPGTWLAPGIADAVRAAAERLARAGHTLVDVPARWAELSADYWRIWSSRLHESFLGASAESLARLDPGLRRAVDDAARGDVASLAASRLRLREEATRLAACFCDVDVLLTPAAGCTATRLGRLAPDGHPAAAEIERTGNWMLPNPYAYPFNLTQQPALAMPLATSDGLPFGLQLVGRRYYDDWVLTLGERLERERAAAT